VPMLDGQAARLLRASRRGFLTLAGIAAQAARVCARPLTRVRKRRRHDDVLRRRTRDVPRGAA
jgi:hypothetical protein